ncbi:MAG: hypothetical protein HYX78_10780 [Armatimonadetes bacterium]|nr:hypothetical protein [Armatimonadota bacterium]
MGIPLDAIGAERKPAILVVSGWPLNRLIDETYKEKMESEGYHLDSCRFEGLTWERMKKFNVLVIEKEPHANNDVDFGYFKAAFPLLNRFLDAGGGLLWLFDPSYGQTHLATNAFTEGYGLEILDEFIFDDNPDHKFQQRLFGQREFITTAQITEHPTTAGIKQIMFPAWPYAAGAFVCSPDWQTLITGEASASASNPYTKLKTFETKPPIFAVREASKGRMAVFPVMSTFTVQAGYHRIWEGLTLDKGNVYALLRNTYDWLGAPSLDSCTVGGFDGSGSATSEAEQCVYNAYPMDLQTAAKHVYVGLIGARSNITGGRDSVAKMCGAARKAGQNFLVFTEPMPKMNRSLWQRLSDECARASWGDFVAIPGFEYKEPDGSTRICFNAKDWLRDDCLDAKGFLRHPATPLFDLNWPTVAYVDSHHPSPSPNAYHQWKFYNTFGMFTYDGGRLIDDSSERYRVLMTDHYFVRPLVYHKMYSASDIAAAAKRDTFKTCALVPSIKEVPQAIGPVQEPFRYFGNSCFVSNGPRINVFTLVSEGRTIDAWESYCLWESGQKGTIGIDVSSDCVITDVILYRGSEIYWHFRPSARRFKCNEPYVFDESGHLRMEVTDAKGHKAYSYPLMTRHNTWWSQMCTDLQNTIQNGVYPDKKGSFPFRDGRRIMYGGMGNQVVGWNSRLLSPTATGEIIPDGLDAIYGGFSLNNGVTMWIDGAAVSPSEERHSFAHATGAVAVLDSHADMLQDGSPCKDFTFVSRNIASPCRPDGYGVVELEQSVTFLRDFTISEATNALPITLLSIGADKNLYPKASFNSDGEVKRIEKDKMTEPIVSKLDRFGGVCFYPQFWGSGCVFAEDGNQYDVRITQSDISIGLNEPGRRFRKGETLTARFLVVRESGRDPDDAGMRKLMSSYGIGCPPAYKLTAHGQVTKGFYPAVVTKDHQTVMRIGKANLANDLVLRVNGLETNWSAGCYDVHTKKLQLLGVFETAAYVPVDTRQATSLFVGNLLTCGSSAARLTLLEFDSSSAKFEVHNLSAKSLTTVVKCAGAKAGLPEFSRSVSLKPGEMKLVYVKHGNSRIRGSR